jgi:alpha-tubulin suppressor-like RCC1 family protein
MDSTSAAPTRVGSVSTWAAVSCGYEQTLALRADGSLWAWGDNFWGSLGLGSTTDKDTPTEVGGAA